MMKWNKISDKEPPLAINLVLWQKGNGWISGKLAEITINEKGKHFSFVEDDHVPIQIEVTHWAIPTKPKE